MLRIIKSNPDFKNINKVNITFEEKEMEYCLRTVPVCYFRTPFNRCNKLGKCDK